MAAWTRCRVASLISPWLLTTRETVLVETPANLATSCSVTCMAPTWEKQIEPQAHSGHRGKDRADKECRLPSAITTTLTVVYYKKHRVSIVRFCTKRILPYPGKYGLIIPIPL